MKKPIFTSVSQDWRTPRKVYDGLDTEFKFDDDPCPSHSLIDGLSRDWGGASYCNPPFKDIAKWAAKAWEQHQQGKTVVLLIPARTDTRWWHDYVMKATEIRFLKGRIGFERTDGKRSRATFPSCVVVFSSVK